LPKVPSEPTETEASDSEEALLDQVLALPQKAAEDRKIRRKLDEEALKLAIASILLGSDDSVGASEEDEEDREQREQQEMKFIKQAEGESMCNDESFLMLGMMSLKKCSGATSIRTSRMRNLPTKKRLFYN